MVLVTILNWNDEANTLNLLNQISRSSKRNEIYVLVVDNGSEEYSKALLKSHEYLCDKIVFLKCNIGFSGGVNVGLKSCLDKKFDACLLLNNDIEFEGDALATLLSKERQMYDYVYGCQIFDFSDRSNCKVGEGMLEKKILLV